MVTFHEMELPKLHIESWSCPFNCGWTRSFHVKPASRANDVIDHPIWGLVTNYQAAQLDIENHDCKAYKAAITRLRGRQLFADKLRRALVRVNLPILPVQR